jgi:hypothetical protein
MTQFFVNNIICGLESEKAACGHIEITGKVVMK